jgi:hypothetical protein
MTVRRAASLLVLIAMLACIHLGAGEAPEAAASTPAVEGGSLLANETKRYVAQLTEQRNQMREENETLRSRQGLLLVYGTLLTLVAGWLMFRALGRRPTGKPEEPGTNPFPVATTVTVRKNATITIRNGSTQQPEMVEKIQTRQAYARSDGSSQLKQVTRIERRVTAKVPAATPPPTRPVIAPELDPATPVMHTPTKRHLATSSVSQAPATVRIEQQSDRLETVEVAVKPGTGTVRKTSGNSARH